MVGHKRRAGSRSRGRASPLKCSGEGMATGWERPDSKPFIMAHLCHGTLHHKLHLCVTHRRYESWGKKSPVTESRPCPYHSCCCRRKCTWLWWTLVLVGVWCFHQCSYSKDSFQLEGVCIDNKWQKFTTVCRFGYLSFLSAYIYFEKCLHPTWCHYFIDSLKCTSFLPFGRKPMVSQAVIQNFWVMSTCSSFAQSHFRILPLKACITSLVTNSKPPSRKGNFIKLYKSSPDSTGKK